MSAFDDLARTLATPMPRRQVLRLAAVVVVTAAVPGLRPRAAGGAVSGDCTGLTPQKCSAPPDASGNAAFECAGKRDHCCSNTKCAGYCRPWQKCDGNGGCDDTAALCTDRDAPRFSKSTPKFCSFQGQEESFCVGKRTKTAGWCCLSGETCGATFGKCTCDGGYCRDKCCGKDEVCRNERTGLCCDKSWKVCEAGSAGAVKCCEPPKTCCIDFKTKSATCCCPKGTTRCGADCCDPKKGEHCSPGSPSPICCPKGQENSKGVCCREGRENCGDGYCCGAKKGESCSGGKCCPNGKVNCGDNRCCEKDDCCGKICCDGRSRICAGGVCCPGDRLVGTGKSARCCPADTVTSPGGTCCPESDPECCSDEDTLLTVVCAKGQTCVQGKCKKL